MGNPFKAMIMGYLLTLFTAAMVLFIPDYDQQYIKWLVTVLIILMLLPIVLSFRFPTNKEKAYRLTLTYQLYAFTFFMTFPLLKVLNGSIIIQLLLVVFFISLYFIARFDQRTEVPIVFPGDDKKMKWMAYVYYAIPVLLVLLGFGTDHRVTRRFFDTYGFDFAMSYLATIIYLFACWLLFFFSSLVYKSHVKEGYLEK